MKTVLNMSKKPTKRSKPVFYNPKRTVTRAELTPYSVAQDQPVAGPSTQSSTTRTQPTSSHSLSDRSRVSTLHISDQGRHGHRTDEHLNVTAKLQPPLHADDLSFHAEDPQQSPDVGYDPPVSPEPVQKSKPKRSRTNTTMVMTFFIYQ